MQDSFSAILLAMLIIKKPVQGRGNGEKCVFFRYFQAVTIGLKKVTNLFQIVLFPHEKSQICPFQHGQFCNVKKKNF